MTLRNADWVLGIVQSLSHPSNGTLTAENVDGGVSVFRQRPGREKKHFFTMPAAQLNNSENTDESVRRKVIQHLNGQ